MSREQSTAKRGTRAAARRKGTRSPAGFSPREQRPRRGAAQAARRSGTRSTSARGARHYQYAASSALPGLRLRTRELNASRVIALTLAGVMMAALVWFFVDERFFVYAAKVRGNSLVTADEIYAASGLHSMSVFYIDRQKVAQNIAHRLPGVTDVHVQCQLPGRVSIRVSEEDVRFVWRVANASFLADAVGRILKADDGTHADLVIVQDLDNKPVGPGDQVDRVALNAAARLHGLLPEVQVFEYSVARGVSLSDSRGWRVYFGDDQRLVEKVATLQTLLLKLEQEHKSVKVIDLRFAGSTYYQ